MHLKSLKVFCDVVGRRSFSRAADENGISQSGASQMVLHLEEDLGVKLIDRSKRPFVLTPEGQVYYDGCRRLVQKFNALEEEVKTLQTSGELLRFLDALRSEKQRAARTSHKCLYFTLTYLESKVLRNYHASLRQEAGHALRRRVARNHPRPVTALLSSPNLAKN